MPDMDSRAIAREEVAIISERPLRTLQRDFFALFIADSIHQLVLRHGVTVDRDMFIQRDGHLLPVQEEESPIDHPLPHPLVCEKVIAEQLLEILVRHPPLQQQHRIHVRVNVGRLLDHDRVNPTQVLLPAQQQAQRREEQEEEERGREGEELGEVRGEGESESEEGNTEGHGGFRNQNTQEGRGGSQEIILEQIYINESKTKHLDVCILEVTC
jgi:hypothetical protein